ncbi:MAG: hypothetical protein JWQ89_1225 [Devosia sp.]|uniref:DUF599 domain-containing protein n=1 Tax=Devosia sp. TaxID=1871048 RepID=UPI0026179B39|nr:DUF599 domain-containing protein [Devosia sp.]MDB5539498.1 hypothetical protein [Devosia sp.]
MQLFATLFPLICWFGYNFGVPLLERKRPSLSMIMSMQRRRWVANAVTRDTPMDAILAGNLMGSVSFLASTSVLLILAVFTAFGNLTALTDALATAGIRASYASHDVQVHLFATLAVFVVSFFAFTLALRQFNHFCILIGAIDHSGHTSHDEVDAIAQLNTLAARNFNNGIRAYYFAVPMVAWFASEWLAIAASIITVGFIIHREFFSSAHRVAASVAVLASRREKEHG